MVAPMKGFDEHLDNYGDPNPSGDSHSVRYHYEDMMSEPVFQDGVRGRQECNCLDCGKTIRSFCPRRQAERRLKEAIRRHWNEQHSNTVYMVQE